jgi:hypothetical protein
MAPVAGILLIGLNLAKGDFPANQRPAAAETGPKEADQPTSNRKTPLEKVRKCTEPGYSALFSPLERRACAGIDENHPELHGQTRRAHFSRPPAARSPRPQSVYFAENSGFARLRPMYLA